MRSIQSVAILTLSMAPAVAAQESGSTTTSLYVGGGTELFGFRDNTTLAWPWNVQVGAMWTRDQSPVAFRLSGSYAERVLGSEFQSFGVTGEVLRELGEGSTNPYFSIGAGLFRNRLTSYSGRADGSVRTDVTRVLTPAISVGFGITRHTGHGAFFAEMRYIQFTAGGRNVAGRLLPLTFGFRF